MQGTALVHRMRLTAWFSKGDIKAGKSPPDFAGSIKVGDHFYPILFDAKSFAGDRWDFSEWRATAKKRHQLKALRDMAAFGGLAFALVRQNSLSTATGATVDAKTGPYHYFDYPAWLVPLENIENHARCDVWSMAAKEMNYNPEGLMLNSRTFPIRGANWLPAAILYAEEQQRERQSK